MYVVRLRSSDRIRDALQLQKILILAEAFIEALTCAFSNISGPFHKYWSLLSHLKTHIGCSTTRTFLRS
jgi:hypothetical protein